MPNIRVAAEDTWFVQLREEEDAGCPHCSLQVCREEEQSGKC